MRQILKTFSVALPFSKSKGRAGVQIALACALTLALARSSSAGLWQYSATIDSLTAPEINGHPRAYLWIPPGCKQVRAVVVAQHNLLEESILLNPKFRDELGKLGIAQIWIMPYIDFLSRVPS